LRGRETICLDDDDENTPCTKQVKLEEKSDAKVKKVEYIADKAIPSGFWSLPVSVSKQATIGIAHVQFYIMHIT